MPLHTQTEGIFSEMVAEALLEAFREQKVPGYGTSTVASAFFRVWMKDRGNAYYFLFKKNLRVTNIQFAELLALISSCSKNRLTDGASGTLHFVSQADFVASVEGLLEAFPDPGADEDARRKKAIWFAETYGHLLVNTVVVDPFYGSCSVHLPPHLETNLAKVCGLSGYIHSCGRNVFIRNVRKATSSHFFEAIDRYLGRHGPDAGKRLFFAVYAHEDFTAFDREQERELADGLHEVKIHIDKFFMSREDLVTVILGLRARFSTSIEVPEPGDFRSEHASTRSGPDIDADRTLWLITDYRKSAGENVERYYVCYDQLYDNKNQLHVFDENKPAWVAHTTISHSLISAMINITMPFWPPDKVVVLDPFVGTGTTWLESFKYGRIVAAGGDNSELALRAAIDNAAFFALDVADLRSVATFIRRVAKQVEGRGGSTTATGDLSITDAALADSVARRARSWAAEPLADDARALALLQEEPELPGRVIFYLALRAHKRHIQAIQRGEETWQEAFAREAAILVQQIETLATLNERARKELATDGMLVECPGSYSRSVSIGLNYLRQLSAAMASAPLRERSAGNLQTYVAEMERLDAIITDPPYGFNTDEDSERLAKLYTDVIGSAMKCLSDDGQLVLCLPESSMIGKSPLTFTHRSVITHQVIAFAELEGKEVISPCRALPGPRDLFNPPYYWRSERGVDRSLLHFRVRPRRT